MDFKQLEAFVAIAKMKSFSKAADSLFITQPTISTHIKNLEHELSTTLINRSSKNIQLTKAGKILHSYAIDILNKRDYALYSLNDYKGEIEGLLEISASSVPEEHLLPDMMRSFHELFPNVKFRILKYDSGIIINKILQGEIDFGIVGSITVSQKLEYTKIMSDEIVLAASPSWKLHQKEGLSSEDLKNFPFIMREKGSGTRKTLEDALTERSMDLSDLNIIATIENNGTIVQCLKRNLGLSFISKKVILNELENGSLILVPLTDLSISRDFHFVYNKNIALSPLAETFRNFVFKSEDHD